MSLVFTVVENQERNNGERSSQAGRGNPKCIRTREDVASHALVSRTRISPTEKKENTNPLTRLRERQEG